MAETKNCFDALHLLIYPAKEKETIRRKEKKSLNQNVGHSKWIFGNALSLNGNSANYENIQKR